MKIAKELAKDGKKLKICKEGYAELKQLPDTRAMMEMYLKNIDFCLSNDYPSNDYFRTNSKGIMEEFGVFLDVSIDLVNIEKCVALGATKGRIEIANFGCSEIFIKHNSELTIIAKDNAFVMIDIFDNAVLHVEANGNAKICINRYGNSVINHRQSDSGVVKVIEKFKKTY